MDTDTDGVPDVREVQNDFNATDTYVPLEPALLYHSVWIVALISGIIVTIMVCKRDNMLLRLRDLRKSTDTNPIMIS